MPLIRRLLSLVLSAAALVVMVAASAASQDTAARPAECHEWHACRQLAIDALARRDYERFHDLAWRTVQTGPPRDPALMYLLARAQSLSGRPDDALVMLDRLADMGVATDAATNDEFKVVRTLRQWPEVEAKISAIATPKAIERATAEEGAAAPTAEPAAPAAGVEPAAAPAVAAPVAPASVSVTSAARPREEAVRIGAVAFRPHGLAYDAVSSRFVVADPDARKLVVFDERSHRALDLVRASSAGFGAIAAFEIDPHRGDLWVVSSGERAGELPAVATLHRLQLVSGRPIARYPVPAELNITRFDDVAITASGVVLMLDAAGRRIVAFDPVAHEFTVAASVDVDGATSLAPADDRSVYVAYRDGIVHVDLSSHTTSSVPAAGTSVLGGLERIRWTNRSLVGVQRHSNGSYGVVEVKLGRRATVSVVADTSIADPTAVTLAGGDLYVLTRGSGRDGNSEVVVQRIRMR